MLKDLFADNEYLNELLDIIGLAVSLSRNGESDTANISRIGQGWIAEEALSIALYCALKYGDDFSAAIIAAVNHDGDSDSTGAITGNIAGARIGYENIPAKWKHDLQLHDLILEIADDLCNGCQIDEYGDCTDAHWLRKYSS
jgi:ADP-ribosylglycohydrolase